jgi:hypothetical protein
MKQIAIIALLLLYSLALRAHTPQISSIALVQSKENKWNLVISASLSAFQYELMNSNPNQKLDSIAADQFQALIVAHLKKNIKIEASHRFATLRNGKVILGHQTDINFEVSGMPDQLESLDLQQLGFGTLRDHYCVLKVITKNNSSNNFILQKGNNFSISLGLKDKAFVEVSPQHSYNWLIICAAMVGILLVLSVVYHKFFAVPKYDLLDLQSS